MRQKAQTEEQLFLLLMASHLVATEASFKIVLVIVVNGPKE